MSRLNGALSPDMAAYAGTGGPSRSAAVMSPSPARQKFPSDALRPHVRSILSSTLGGVQWDAVDKARMSSVSKDISERVKRKMLELVPRGFKYIVTVTMTENLGQAGRADLSCHWEDTDAVIQEMYSTDTLIFVCVAFAIRVA